MYSVYDSYNCITRKYRKYQLIEYAKTICPFYSINSTYQAIKALREVGYEVMRIDLLF